jgi:hypothetical protein
MPKPKRRKKHQPQRYLKYKGCFGSYATRWHQFKHERLHGALSIDDEEDFGFMTDALNQVMNNPDLVLDFGRVTNITISAALVLKAFVDEFMIRHKRKPRLHGPRDMKTRAILNYLNIAHYKDADKHQYEDIKCWQILDWEQGEAESKMEFSKLLHTEIIPKCWSGRHAMSQHSANMATAITEALFNCREHAYTGDKKNSPFKKWYLGVGEYPNTRRFSFCIYDKGVGIKARLKENPSGWLDSMTDGIKSDSKMIERATKGRSGAPSGKGRGEGLKVAIELLASNRGRLDIYSDYGYFSTWSTEGGKDRSDPLEGTLVAFSFPIEYNKE